MSTAKEIVLKLKQKNIELFYNDGNIDINSYENKIDQEDIDVIRSYKNDLIAYLKTDLENKSSKIKKAEPTSFYPLSAQQKALWMISQDTKTSTAYNTYNFVELHSESDFQILEKAIRAVIKRHEILRTVFKKDENGEPKQCIVEIEDLESTPYSFVYNDKEEDAYHKIIKEDIVTPFDLEKGPLLRVYFFQISEGRKLCFYNMHHIITDGWSIDVLSKDLLRFYNVFKNKENLLPQPLKIQYKDYAVWQSNKFLEQDFIKANKSFWKQQLDGELPVLDLPFSMNRPPIKTYNGHNLKTNISKECTEKLTKYCLNRDGSLFIGLLSVLNVLFNKYTSQSDIIIGSLVAGRNHIDLIDQIGYYVNTIPLRNYLDKEDNFDSFFEKVKKNTFSALQHQEYPFVKIIEDIDYKSDISRNPFFDTVLIFEKSKKNERHIISLNDEQIEDKGAITSKFDLKITFIEKGDRLCFDVVYNSNIFKKDVIGNFIRNFKELLKNLLVFPSQKITSINYLTKEERKQLIDDFSTSYEDYPKEKTIVDLFVEQVETTPNKEALRFHEETITYKELYEKSLQLKTELLKRGASHETMIPVFLDGSIEMVIGILGIMMSGAAYVPLDYDFPINRIDLILEEISADFLVTESKWLKKLEGLTRKLDLVYVDQLSKTLNNDLAQVKPKPNDLAYILFTSGSTGAPKGVMIEHGNIVDYTFGFIERVEIDMNKSFATMSTFSTDLANTFLYISLITGGVIHIFSKEDLQDSNLVYNYLNSNSLDYLKMTPSYWISLNYNDGLNLPKKGIVLGGEELSPEIIKDIKQKDDSLVVVNHYGPTETTIGKVLNKVDFSKEYNKVPLGKPFSNARVYIVDDNQNLVPVGIEGELYIGGPGVARGYLNNTKLTNEKFIDNPFVSGERVYKTGDLVKWLPNGELEFISRKDYQVKIRGYRVELGEIESVIQELEEINQAVVIINENELKDKKIIAFIKCNLTIDNKRIQSLLLERLPVYMVPSVFVQLDEFPLTSNGKVDRKKLDYVETKEESNTYVTPKNDIESDLIKIWEKVLCCSGVGVLDNFYEIGGNSLDLIKVMAKCRNIGYEIGFRDFIINPTIRAISNGISESRNVSIVRQIKAGNEKENSKYFPLSENQNYMKERSVVCLFTPIIINKYSIEDFKTSFLNFISYHPSLCVSFKAIKGELMQYFVEANEVKVNFFENDTSPRETLLERYDNLESEIIRVSVVENEESLKVQISIPYFIIDAKSKALLTRELESFLTIDNYKMQKSLSNNNFLKNQQQILNSNRGELAKTFWKEKLSSLELIKTYPKIEKWDNEYISQRSFITGEYFEGIITFSKQLNISPSVLVMLFFKYMLKELNFNSTLINVRVDGREYSDSEFDAERFIGVMNNSIPISVNIDDRKSFENNLHNNFLEFNEARMYQYLPFSVIRRDYYSEQKQNIEDYIIGVFNYNKLFKSYKSGQGNVNYKNNVKLYMKDKIVFNCYEHEDAFEIELLCIDHLYNEASKSYELPFQLKAFFEKIQKEINNTAV